MSRDYLSTLQAATEILGHVGIMATLEYPGFLAVPTVQGIAVIGNANGDYGAGLYRSADFDGEPERELPFILAHDADAEALAAAVTALVVRLAQEANHVA